MRESLEKKSKEFAECIANRINELSKCNDDFSVIIDTCNDMSNPACFCPNTGIVSINEKYFEEHCLQENQEVLDCLLESTIAHEILHIYLYNKNIDLEKFPLNSTKLFLVIDNEYIENCLANFIHHLFIPKLIDILGYDNDIFFNEIRKIYTNFETDKEFGMFGNAISLSLDFWFNDKMQNKSRDVYASERKEYMNVCVFNKCCDFLEKFPFDDMDFNCDFSDKKFFEPLVILFDEIYQYIVEQE